LQSIHFTTTSYNINGNNNCIVINDETIIIEQGFYNNIEDLLIVLNKVAKHHCLFHCSKINNKISVETGVSGTLSKDLKKTLTFTGSLCKVLGFQEQIYKDKRKYTAEETFCLEKNSNCFLNLSSRDEELKVKELISFKNGNNHIHNPEFKFKKIVNVESLKTPLSIVITDLWDDKPIGKYIIKDFCITLGISF
jgi:hypothetical protein